MNAEGQIYPPGDSWVVSIHASPGDVLLGAGVVIDDHRVLTCAHVVRRDGVNRKGLWVAFPKADQALGEHCRMASIAPGGLDEDGDVAVLLMAERVPPGVAAAPLKCPQPGDLAGARWWAFGFPARRGNAADGVVGVALTRGWIRIDAGSRYRLEPGFSGSGVWSPDYQAVIGLVSEVNERGDGQAVTLHRADACLPGQGLRLLAERWSAADAGETALAAWGWELAADPEARRHWRPRARGVSVDSERGYRFRGRSAALRAIAGWLDRDRLDRRVLLVTGAPGAGKSAVLGRIVTTADPDAVRMLPRGDVAIRASPGSVACSVHAKGKTALEIASEIARAASAALPDQVEDLAPALRDALAKRAGRRFSVIIDALDEAASPEQSRIAITKVILPLTETCSDVGAQVVVGARHRDGGGDLLAVFGVAGAVIDLDDPQFFAEEDLVAFAQATLQLAGDEREGNPYAADAVAGAVARRIAQMAAGNFLIAGLTARSHGLHDDQAVDPARLAFTATVDAAMREYLRRLPPVVGVPAEAALTALAFAQVPGLTASLWQVAARALGTGDVSASELARFARSTAADFVVETSGPDGRDTQFQLFHQALNDTLLRARAQVAVPAEDERSLAEAFRETGRLARWEHVPTYLLRSLAVHAARGGTIDALLADDDYLLHADLARLLSLVESSASAASRQRVRLLRLTPDAITAGPAVRTALFSVTQALENLSDVRLRSSTPAPYHAAWAATTARTEESVLESHTGYVEAVCGFTLGGRTLLATGSYDGTVRIWDAATGIQDSVLETRVGWISVMCAFTLGDRTVLAIGGQGGRAAIWDPATGIQQQALDRGTASPVHAMCPFNYGGRTLLAVNNQIWDPTTGTLRTTLPRNVGVACAFTLGNRTLLATGSRLDCMLRIWDPACWTRQSAWHVHTGTVCSLCVFSVNGRTLLAVGCSDQTVQIWDPVTGTQQSVLSGHSGAIDAMCTFSVDGRPLLATGVGDFQRSSDQTVRIWDPVTGTQQSVLSIDRAAVRSLCAFPLRGRMLLAVGCSDRMTRIFTPITSRHESAPGGYSPAVTAMCSPPTEGRALLTVGSGDRMVRIWDLATGSQKGAMQGPAGWVTDMSAFALGDRVLLAASDYDGTLRIWDLATGARQTVFDKVGATAVCALTHKGRTLLAVGRYSGELLFWNPATGTQHLVRHSPSNPTIYDSVSALCALVLDGRTLLAVGHDHGDLRIWDPWTLTQRLTMRGRAGSFNTLCALTLNDRALLATGSRETSPGSGLATVRIWDPSTGTMQSVMEGHKDAITAMCAFSLGDSTLLATGCADRTVRIWDPETTAPVLAVPLRHQVKAVSYNAGLLVVGTTAGLLALELNPALRELTLSDLRDFLCSDSPENSQPAAPGTPDLEEPAHLQVDRDPPPAARLSSRRRHRLWTSADETPHCRRAPRAPGDRRRRPQLPGRPAGRREHLPRPPAGHVRLLHPVADVHAWLEPGRFFGVFPVRGGLAMAFVQGPRGQYPAFRRDPLTAYVSELRSRPSLADLLFRTSSGPGWALAGDAGHHKDPVIARGIADAFRDADLLASAVVDGWDGDLEAALVQYGHQHDRCAIPLSDANLGIARLDMATGALGAAWTQMNEIEQALDATVPTSPSDTDVTRRDRETGRPTLRTAACPC